ncbi:SCO family protein [Shewanella cyperi]|uniref:SCO family protein n=2 Tax=Shewanella TaxID=22 RepID=A0A975AL24_9GAMM|nr:MULTISPECIES: SCO family protein [Shewanella]QSX29972.1 SCO family protein [Shewanella cyperi]QSX37149.1 SCO family protein [Shewanella sedimentimangrovi]
MEKRWLVSVILAIGLGGLALLGLTGSKGAAPELETGFVFPEPRTLSDFKLTDQNGSAFTREALQGKWSLVFAGYTSCPDVCPTTMGLLNAIYPTLVDKAPFQVLFLSVDPERDSTAKLKDYMAFFNPAFKGLSGPHATLLPLTRELGLVYAMVGEGKNYQVDHSASLVLLSPEGRRLAVFKPQAGKILSSSALSADISKLMAWY